MIHPRSVSSVVLLILAALTTPLSFAEDWRGKRKQFDATPLTSRWRVFAGGTFSTLDTEVGFTPTGLIGGLIRLEDDLGLQERVNAYSMGASFGIGSHHRLQFEFVNLDRDSVTRLDKQFEFGDFVFDVGAEVRTEFRTTLVRTKWRYSFSDSGRLDAGLTAGLSTFGLKISLAGAARLAVDGDGVEVRDAVEGAQFIAPVPLIAFTSTMPSRPG